MFWNFPELLRVYSDDFGGVPAWWTGRMDPNSTLFQSAWPPSDTWAKSQRFGKLPSPAFAHILRSIFWRRRQKVYLFVLQPRVILASLVLYICFLSLSSMQVSLRTVSIIVTYKWTWGWKYWYTNVSSNWCWLWCTAADATYCWWCWCSNADAVAANTNLCWCFLCCRLFKACRGRGRDLGEAKAG